MIRPSLPWFLLVRAAFRNPRLLRPVEKPGARKNLNSVEEDQVRVHLNKLDIHESMGPDGLHPRVLKELGDVLEATLD